jgi:light-harvesting complex I chlorophyll a/b binding protein 4
MATVSTQASIAALRPCTSRSKFLGAPVRIAKVAPVLSRKAFKVEAKKGEWLPGLASPTYLNGR